MKTTELKKVIRSMVRECVHELLAEKYIERSINEMASTKKKLRESVAYAEPVKPKKKPAPTLTREEMARKYNLDEDGPMVDIFQDTMSTNPVINGEDKDPPGTVSERVMEKSGIMSKDWTKYF